MSNKSIANADLVWFTLAPARKPIPAWEILAEAQLLEPTLTADQVRSALNNLRRQGQVIRVRKELRHCPKRGWVTVPVYATSFAARLDEMSGKPSDSENVSTFVQDVLDYLCKCPYGPTVREIYEQVLPHMTEASGLSAARIYLASLMKTGHVRRLDVILPDRNGHLRRQWVYYATYPQPDTKPTSYRGLLLEDYS